jgi:SAM-dependent methyltransferase
MAITRRREDAMTTGAANAEALAGIYTAVADAYEELWEPKLRPFSLRLLDLVPLARAGRVLDLGCGVGQLLPRLAARAPRAIVIGVDLAEGMLRRGPAGFPRVTMDWLRPALAPRSFDAIISSFVLFHIPSPLAALVCARELLRSGGAFAAAVWGANEVFPAWGEWDEALDRAGVPKDPATKSSSDGKEQTNSAEKMVSLLQTAGFSTAQANSVEWLARWQLADFVDLRSRMGPSGRRLSLLDASAREAVIAQVTANVKSLPEDSFLQRDEVILASGCVLD